MNRGRIEQAEPPVNLYDKPQSEFVTGFIGPANKLGDSFIRPRDLQALIAAEPGAEQATVWRIVQLHDEETTPHGVSRGPSG